MRPSISERIARHASNNAERERKESERVKRAIAHMALQEDLTAWKERTEFDMYIVADRIFEALEKQRDMHTPKSYDDVWDEDFCTAVALLPEARQFADDCMMNCMKVI